MTAEANPAVVARVAWAAAASALARGDREAFARHAGEAAIHVAASGDVDGAAALAHVRAGILGMAAVTGSPGAAFAEALDRGPAAGDVARGELLLWWRYVRALVAALPEAHPLLDVAAEDGWDAISFDVMIATLVAGEVGASPNALAAWTGHERHAVAAALSPEGVLRTTAAIAAVTADGVLRTGAITDDDAITPNPILWAACAARPSPLLSTASPSAPAARAAGDADLPEGVVVLTAMEPEILQSAVEALPVRPLFAPDADMGAWWAARDARWRGRPLALVLDAAPGPRAIEVLLTVPHVVVLTDPPNAAWLAANLGAARSLRIAPVTPLSPADATARLAAALETPAAGLRVGHLYASDVDRIIRAIAVRGDDAIWALSAALRERATVALGPLAFDLHGPSAARVSRPPSNLARTLAAALDRARELFAGSSAWTAPPVAVTVEGDPDMPAWVAAELATERGRVAAVVDLDAFGAWRDVTTALDVLRRYGGVLAVRNLTRAPQVCIFALAYALQRAQVSTIIGIPPVAAVPLAIRKLAPAL